MVIWISGLSGAGKTTVCRLLYDRLKSRVPELVLLDGDDVRDALGNDLGYSEEDRVRQVKRVQRLSRLLSLQGLIVVVAIVYSHPYLLAWNRQQIPEYFEVLLDAPLDLVRRRDSKGVYAQKGETRNVVGHDIPWHRPALADLVLDLTGEPSAEELAARIVHAIPRLSAQWNLEPADAAARR